MKLQLQAWPNRSLFFGLFVYFAVRLFYRPDLPLAGGYLWCLGLCFTLSVSTVTTSTLLRIRLDKVPQSALETFACRLNPLLRFLRALYELSFILFFGGCAVLSQVKQGYCNPWERNLDLIITPGALQLLYRWRRPSTRRCTRSMHTNSTERRWRLSAPKAL
jgi:hypothetical protein